MACSFVFVHYKHTQQLLAAATRPCSHRDTLDTQHTLPSIPSVILTPAEQYYHTLPQPLSQHSNVFNFPPNHYSVPPTPQLMERYSAGNVLPLPQTPKMLHRYSSEVSEHIADHPENCHESEEEEEDGDSTNDSMMEREGTELEGTSMMKVSDLIAPASPSKKKRRSLHMTQAVFMGEKVVYSQHAHVKRRCAICNTFLTVHFLAHVFTV